MRVARGQQGKFGKGRVTLSWGSGSGYGVSFLQRLWPLGGSVAVLKTVEDWVVRLVSCQAGCWLIGWVVDRLGALSSRQTHSWEEGFWGAPAASAPCRCQVVLFVVCFTSYCSAVSLPPRSSPRPGPCDSHVWGSGSCGC